MARYILSAGSDGQNLELRTEWQFLQRLNNYPGNGFSQELCDDAPLFLVDHRRDALPRQRRESLVESGVLALRDGLLKTLLERAATGLYTCGDQRSLLLRQLKNEWPIAEIEVGTP